MNFFDAAAGPTAWLTPSALSGLGEYALFRLINSWLGGQINDLGLAMMGRMMRFVAGIGLPFATAWILFHGYRIMAGAREPMMGLVVKGMKFALVFGIATTMGLGNIQLHGWFTEELDSAVHELVTGKTDQTTADAIDKNLAMLQVAMTAIDSVQLLEPNAAIEEEKKTAKHWATLGVAGPALMAGVMLLLWKFVIALWIGFAPLFIFGLMFEQTKPMFFQWLKYGIGTLFSMAVLSFVSNLVLELTLRVSAGLWIAKLANIPGLAGEGITSQAMTQGGVGLVLTLLIMTVPPVAAHFFGGQIGNALHYSAFDRSNQPGPLGQQPGSYDKTLHRGDDRTKKTLG